MKYFVELGDGERYCPQGMLFEAYISEALARDWWDEKTMVFRCSRGERHPVFMWEDDSGYVVDLL